MENVCKIVTVSRIASEKGQMLALQIAERLKANNLQFEWTFVGDGPDMDACLENVSIRGLKDCCFFVGAKTNPYPYIKMADIYVAPSFVEADPVTIQEAMILNKVIVSSDISALSEALGGGMYGLLCSNTNVDGFVKAIMDLSQNKERCSYYLKNIKRRESRNIASKQKILALLDL